LDLPFFGFSIDIYLGYVIAGVVLVEEIQVRYIGRSANLAASVEQSWLVSIALKQIRCISILQ